MESVFNLDGDEMCKLNSLSYYGAQERARA